MYRELSITGKHSAFLAALTDIAESASSAVLLGVMLFASLGWSLTRDHLSRREYQLIFMVFFVYSAIALVKALCDSEDDDDICKAYLLTEYVIKSVLMLGVIVALNFTISQLRLALAEARWDNFVTPLTYMKLNQFQYASLPMHWIGVLSCDLNGDSVCFPMLQELPSDVPALLADPNVFADPQCTRFRSLLIYSSAPPSPPDHFVSLLLFEQLVVITPPGSWRYDWVNDLLSECATLFIYVNVALVLRPLDPYIYARVCVSVLCGCCFRPSAHPPPLSLPDIERN